MGKGNENIKLQINTFAAQIELLNSELYGYRADLKLIKELIDQMIVFKKGFDDKNGWVPKIISTVTANFRKDINNLKTELMEKFDKLPCFNLTFDDEGILQSRCRIANESDPLKPDEKEMKP